jgi:hypothetical protein
MLDYIIICICIILIMYNVSKIYETSPILVKYFKPSLNIQPSPNVQTSSNVRPNSLDYYKSNVLTPTENNDCIQLNYYTETDCINVPIPDASGRLHSGVPNEFFKSKYKAIIKPATNGGKQCEPPQSILCPPINCEYTLVSKDNSTCQPLNYDGSGFYPYKDKQISVTKEAKYGGECFADRYGSSAFPPVNEVCSATIYEDMIVSGNFSTSFVDLVVKTISPYKNGSTASEQLSNINKKIRLYYTTTPLTLSGIGLSKDWIFPPKALSGNGIYYDGILINNLINLVKNPVKDNSYCLSMTNNAQSCDVSSAYFKHNEFVLFDLVDLNLILNLPKGGEVSLQLSYSNTIAISSYLTFTLTKL